MQRATFVQAAYYVADVFAAVPQWTTRFGAGPFFVIEHIALTDVVVRGRPSRFDHTSAYGWHGDLMVELVQQNCATPSIFNDRPHGLHHMAYFAADLDAELQRLAALGMPTAMTATTGNGLRFAFADAHAQLGHYLELYEDVRGIRDFYQFVRSAAADWDGNKPLRTL